MNLTKMIIVMFLHCVSDLAWLSQLSTKDLREKVLGDPFANATFENILPRLSLLADFPEGEEHRNVCTCSSSIKAAGCYAVTLSTQTFTLHRNASRND